MQVIQFEDMEDDTLNTNGWNQFEDNVCIQGKKFSSIQKHLNLEVYFVVQHIETHIQSYLH
jgi:hypothetical protein